MEIVQQIIAFFTSLFVAITVAVGMPPSATFDLSGEASSTDVVQVDDSATIDTGSTPTAGVASTSTTPDTQQYTNSVDE